MANDDMRYYETFYAIHNDDWKVNFATFSDHHKLLTKEYINEGCSTTDHSTATDIHEFIYPHHIKKTYFIEGVIYGQITLAAYGDESTITSYKVSLLKIHENNTITPLFDTGWVTVSDTLAWDAEYSIGEEMVYPFWIDAWNKAELNEKEKIFLRVEVNCDNDTVLWHSNNAAWEDIRIEIPFKFG